MVVAGAPNKSTFHAHHICDMVSMLVLELVKQ